VEQKYTNCPFTFWETLPTVETYVPHTGSFFNSPPMEIGGAAGRAWPRGAEADRKLAKIFLSRALRNRRTRRGKMISTNRNFMGSGRKP
jgi:hypothetical protein